MSTTVPADATAAGRTQSPGPAPTARRRRGIRHRLAEVLAGTPAQLSTWSVATIGALVLFGVAGGLAVYARAAALTDAREDARQLVHLQVVRTSLMQADAAATNAYLAGGLEVPAQRDLYLTSLTTASRQLGEVGGDGRLMGDLADVNEALVGYSGMIEAARANNRQSFPVGAAYLRRASNLLREEMMPALQAASDTTAGRVRDAYQRADRAVIPLVMAGVVVIAVLVAGQLWLARRVRRFVNVPLAVASGLAVGSLVVALGAMGWASGRAERVRTGPSEATEALAQARTNAFDAKSIESRMLISRGPGASEVEWRLHSGEASTQLQAAADAGAADLQAELDAWRAVHAEVSRFDEAGDWKGAVNLATGTAPGSSNETFATFAAASASALDAQVDAVQDGLGQTRPVLLVVAALVLAAGLIAAVVAWWGYAIRLEEYR